MGNNKETTMNIEKILGRFPDIDKLLYNADKFRYFCESLLMITPKNESLIEL